jgi:hypothetical protein
MNHDSKGLVYCEKYVKSLEEMVVLLKKENERIILLLDEK